jgi:hypothetical protein
MRRARIERESTDREARQRSRLRPRPKPREQETEEEQPRERMRAAQRGKPSAIVSRDRLRAQRSGIERAMAWLVLLVSFAGSIAALHGGFAPLIASVVLGPLNLGALLGGVLIQALLTFLEWYYFDRWSIAWGARGLDTALTAIGYGPLFVPPLLALLASRNAPSPLLLAWGIIVLVSFGVAYFPESRLVD